MLNLRVDFNFPTWGFSYVFSGNIFSSVGFNIFLTLMSQSEFQLFGKNFICGGLSLKTIFYKRSRRCEKSRPWRDLKT